MTNAERYLKNENYTKDFIRDYMIYCERKKQDSVNLESLSSFFREQVQPTLTEEERVILKNIGEDCISLMRVNGAIFFHTEGKGIFPKLFQFIKERRRI